MQDESLNSPSLEFGTPRLGFGMLRIDPENPEHRAALREALVRGVDLFDLGDFAVRAEAFTAKETLLRALVAEYAPGPVRVLVRGNLGAADRFLPLDEAKIEWIYLVADPEFALPTLEWDHSRLYTLLAHELDTLESLVASGEISGYGVASAALTYAKENPEALALEPLLGSSSEWSSAPTRPANRRGFGWIEFPFNLYESEAETEETQVVGARTETLFAAARRWGLRTVARRPLDAITGEGLRRLVNYPDHHRLDLHEAVRLTLETALAAEEDLSAAGTGIETHWAHRLRDQLKHVNDPEQWKEILRRKIDPDLKSIAERLERSGVPSSSSGTSESYLDAMKALTLAVRLFSEKTAAERNERLRCRVVEASPTLSRKRRAEDRDLALIAFRIYRSIPDLSYVLVGMRSPKYVQSFTAAQAASAADELLPRDELRSALIAAHTALQKDSS